MFVVNALIFSFIVVSVFWFMNPPLSEMNDLRIRVGPVKLNGNVEILDDSGAITICAMITLELILPNSLCFICGIAMNGVSYV